MLTTAKALRRYRDQIVSVMVDDEPELEIAITNYAVCNAQYFGSGMWVAPHAKPDDGRFDVTIWAGFGLKDFIMKHRSIYTGAHVYDPGTRVLQAKKVVASSKEPVLLDVDGESAGRLPATITVLPSALRFKV